MKSDLALGNGFSATNPSQVRCQSSLFALFHERPRGQLIFHRRCGSTLYCQGTATSPVYIVRYNTVQEQSATNFPCNDPGPLDGPSVDFYAWYPGDTSSMYCTFTKWFQLAVGMHFWAESSSNGKGVSS
jgi:hypothetical protein